DGHQIPHNTPGVDEAEEKLRRSKPWSQEDLRAANVASFKRVNRVIQVVNPRMDQRLCPRYFGISVGPTSIRLTNAREHLSKKTSGNSTAKTTSSSWICSRSMRG